MRNKIFGQFNCFASKGIKFIAFTLAETLMVMGIIGVVSALTLPHLNNSKGDQEAIARVKKAYAALSEGFARAQAVYGLLNEWPVDSNGNLLSSTVGERLTEFMKVSKNCGINANQGCFSSESAKLMNGANYMKCDVNFVGVDPVQAYRFTTSEGMSFALVQYSVRTHYSILVDIDGPHKGRNTFGRDLFYFMTDPETFQIKPYASSEVTNFTSLYNSIYVDGRDAAAWVLKYNNMDYLKLDSSGKCPDGTAPTVSNPRCD